MAKQEKNFPASRKVSREHTTSAALSPLPVAESPLYQGRAKTTEEPVTRPIWPEPCWIMLEPRDSNRAGLLICWAFMVTCATPTTSVRQEDQKQTGKVKTPGLCLSTLLTFSPHKECQCHEGISSFLMSVPSSVGIVRFHFNLLPSRLSGQRFALRLDLACDKKGCIN